MLYKIKVLKQKEKGRQQKEKYTYLFLSVVLNLDTKEEIMTQLRLKILNHLYLHLPLMISTFPSLSDSIFSRLMTDLCQTVSWLILLRHFAEMKYRKSKTKRKLLVPKNLPSSTTNSKESSKYLL